VLADADGRCLARLDLGEAGAAPRIASVRPLAVTPDYHGPVLVTGTHVGGPGDTIFCRSGGGAVFLASFAARWPPAWCAALLLSWQGLGLVLCTVRWGAVHVSSLLAAAAQLPFQPRAPMPRPPTPTHPLVPPPAASFPTAEVVARGPLLEGVGGRPCGAVAPPSWALLRIPALPQGCLSIEAQHGDFVSPPAALLVLEDAAAVAELRQLELPGCAGTHDDASELLHRLGAVLRFAGCPRAGDGDEALAARVRAAAQVSCRLV
jgi:hypothetical protein